MFFLCQPIGDSPSFVADLPLASQTGTLKKKMVSAGSWRHRCDLKTPFEWKYHDGNIMMEISTFLWKYNIPSIYILIISQFYGKIVGILLDYIIYEWYSSIWTGVGKCPFLRCSKSLSKFKFVFGDYIPNSWEMFNQLGHIVTNPCWTCWCCLTNMVVNKQKHEFDIGSDTYTHSVSIYPSPFL